MAPNNPSKMQAAIQLRQKEHNKFSKKYLLSAIGLACMFFFGYIPAPEPITPAGMTILGVFIGLVFLWTTVDLIWPLFPAMVVFATVYKDLFPASWQSAGIYEATQQSFGNWVVQFILLCLVLCVALEECGIIRRIALWFLSTPFARKGPRAFTISMFLATLVIGLFMDATPTQAFMLSIAYEIFEEIGYKPGEKWPKVVVMGITCTAAISYAMTPIGHAIPLLVLGLLSSNTGMAVNFVSYMVTCIPIGLIVFVALCAWVLLVLKPDMTKLASYDLDGIDKIRPGKMERREKWITGLSGVLVIAWVGPGLLSLFAPDSAVSAFFNRHTSLMPLVLAVGALGIIQVDGKPLLDLNRGFKKVNWQPVLLLCGIMMASNGLSAAGSGINAFMSQKIFPLITGFSPWIIIAAICILSCILTNFLSNSAVGAVFITAGVALALEMGLNPMYMGVAVCFGANMAFLFPSSFVPVSVAYATPWCGGSTMLKNGAVMMAISCIVMAVLVYPMCTLIFG